MRFLITLVFFTILSFSFSQVIVVVDQNGEKLENQSFFVKIVIDNDSTITFNTDKFNVSRDLCDDLAEIYIAGDFVQTYVNQYLPTQFKLLDTIRVYQSRNIAHTSPILLIDIKQEIDSILLYDLGFSSTLKQIGLPFTLTFNVFHADRITKKEKKFIEKVKKTYCGYLGIDCEKIKLIDENKAYVSVQQDFFSKGTIITRDFINSQNTYWMKEQAEKYKLVMWLMINWEK